MGSRSDNFFNWVWKINGLLVLSVSLAALGAILTLTFSDKLFGHGDRPEQKITQVAGSDIRKDDLQLGDFIEVKGTTLLYASLRAKSDRIASGSSYGQGDARNLLFFDTKSKKVRWLLNGNEQIIPSVSFITDPESEDYEYSTGGLSGKSITTQSILLEIAPLGTDGSTIGGRRRLALASPNGESLLTVAEGIDGLLGKHKTSEQSLLAFYSIRGEVRVVEIDLEARTVTSDSALSTTD